MTNRLSKISLLSLSFFCAVLWRLEIEWRWGWASTDWLEGSHLAVPIGVASFLVWVFAFCGVTPLWKRTAFVTILTAFAYVSATFFVGALVLNFVAGPSAFALIATPRWMYYAYDAVFPLVPLGVCAIAKIFGVRVTWKSILVSVALFLLAWPTTIILLRLVNHKGGGDIVNAVKSGFVIPFLVSSLGMPFLGRTKSTSADFIK